MTTRSDARQGGVDGGPKEAEPKTHPRILGVGWPFASLEDEQSRAKSFVASMIDVELTKLGIRPVPNIEEPVPEPDFRSAGILFGPQFLFDALTRRNEMYECLSEGNIEEAIEIAEEIVTDFPTPDVRRWLTNGKDLREEFKGRCDDFVNNSFEALMPRLNVSTSWVLSKEWRPYAEEEREGWQEFRRLIIAKRYLRNEFGARLIDTIHKISAFMPMDTRILPEDLRFIDEETRNGDGE